MDLSVFLDPAALLALAGLVALELVLAVDNLIFITILTSRLPEHQQPMGRKLGLLGAVITRIMLLLSAAWLITLTAPWFTVSPSVTSSFERCRYVVVRPCPWSRMIVPPV